MGRLFWIISGCWLAVAQQYPFLPVAGSPKNPQALFQDSKGRLWIAGTEPAWFDGSRFFFLRDYGFPATAALDITEDAGGAIWIGAETGVYRFADGRVEELAKGVAISVIAGSADTVAAAISPLGQSLYKNAELVRIQRQGTGWKTETLVSLDSPGPLTLDAAGNLLYPWTTHGWGEIRLEDVVRWKPGTTLAVQHRGARGDPTNGRWQVMRDRSGCFWGVAPHSNASYDCGDGAHLALPDNAALEARMHEATDGNIVLSGGSVLAVGRPGRFRIATRANGLPAIVDALPARDGTIWLAAFGGLYRFAAPFQIESWTIREGVPDPPWSIARVGGNIYAGLQQRIVRLDPDRRRWSSMATFPQGGSVTGLLGTPDGRLFASFIDGGAVELRADGQVVARTENGHPKSGSMRWASTPEGEIWLGGNTLAQVTQKGSVLTLREHPLRSKPTGNVLSIKYEERTRNLWACYNGGLVRRDARGEWSEFDTRDGLRTNGCWSVAPLPDGDLWYAYFNLRAFAYIHPGSDGGIAVRQYDSKSVWPNTITLDVDHANRLWRSGDGGLYVADPQQAKAGEWLKLDQTDGFPADDMNTGSVFVDGDESLWWGADNDLAHYSAPADLVAPGFAPRVFVSAFSWEGQAPRLAEAVGNLPHGSKITAHIGSLQFDRRHALAIRYRVLPEQAGWTETKDLDLKLGALGAGGHTLEVQGRVFGGPWSRAERQSFTVLRPGWLAWPFLITYLIAVPVLATGGYMARQKRRREDSNLLPDLAPWRMEAFLPEVYELTGSVLNSRFEVGSILARGGFAHVLDGYDRQRQQRCAIKVFRSEVTDAKDRAWIEHRFEQEVAALERVQHPNVVSIYAHGAVPSGIPFLVMEFIEGRSLREILVDGGIRTGRAAVFLGQLASALDAIHAHGICHRDVKPDNIIIRGEGSRTEAAVLLDFSIAIVKDANKTLHGVSRAAGTFAYMAPEQAVGHAEPSSDVYSLAKVTIEMLTGRSVADLVPDATIDLPERVREMLGTLPLGLSGESIEMLACALEFDPGRRPRAAGAFAQPLVNDLRLKS